MLCLWLLLSCFRNGWWWWRRRQSNASATECTGQFAEVTTTLTAMRVKQDVQASWTIQAASASSAQLETLQIASALKYTSLCAAKMASRTETNALQIVLESPTMQKANARQSQRHLPNQQQLQSQRHLQNQQQLQNQLQLESQLQLQSRSQYLEADANQTLLLSRTTLSTAARCWWGVGATAKATFGSAWKSRFYHASL